MFGFDMTTNLIYRKREHLPTHNMKKYLKFSYYKPLDCPSKH